MSTGSANGAGIANGLEHRLRAASGLWNACAGAIAVVLVRPIVRLTPQEFHTLLWIMIPLATAAAALSMLARSKQLRGLRELVELDRRGALDARRCCELFELVMNLPRQEVVIGAWCWVLVPLVIVLLLLAYSPTLTITSSLVIGLAALCAGGYSQIFVFYHFKRLLEPVRLIAASGIGDPATREELTRELPLSRKLTLVVCSLIVGATFFSLSAGLSRMHRRISHFATGAQQQQLAGLSGEAADLLDQPERLASEPLTIDLGIAERLLVDAATGAVLIGPPDLLLPNEIATILSEPGDSGDSSKYSTPTSYAWKRLDDGRHILIVATVKSALTASFATERNFILLAALVAIGVGITATRVITNDLDRSFRHLTAQLDRVGSGNLRELDPYESEDELGRLARRIDGMTRALRETVAGVVAGADRVELSASAIDSASLAVRTAGDDQDRRVHEVTAAMERIREHVEGIRESAHLLDESVENSYSSVRELTTAGRGLGESSEELDAQVRVSASAVDGAAQSIESVLQTADQLAQAADGTSASVEEMAASLRSIDVHAAETALLSEKVLESAHAGRSKVQETIEGMGAIQRDRESISELVQDLAQQTEGIEQIVEVITSVTDETKLLALNAAIIAAQAGEQGRAFAVVADQIKELASRVLASAKEIVAVVDSVKRGAQAAVDATQRGRQVVEHGAQLSNEAGVLLVAITEAARASGERMQGVVKAVREQSSAASRAVELMIEVSSGVEHIKQAGRAQVERTREVSHANEAMGGAAGRVREAAGSQARSSQRITEAVERVNEVTHEIVKALADESVAVATVGELLDRVNERSAASQASNREMSLAARELLEQAAVLREGVQRFEI